MTNKKRLKKMAKEFARQMKLKHGNRYGGQYVYYLYK